MRRVGFHYCEQRGLSFSAVHDFPQRDLVRHDPGRRVPHPCAFYAQGWDSTTASSVGFSSSIAYDLPSRNLIQHDTGRHPRIQRLDLRRMRNGNQFVGLSDPIPRHARPLPHRSRQQPARQGWPEVRSTPLCDEVATSRTPFSRSLRQHIRQLCPHHRQPENRSRRSPHHFRIKRAYGALAQNHPSRPKRLRRPQNRPQIPRILQPRNHDQRARPTLSPADPPRNSACIAPDAATPCGVSLGTTLAKSLSGSTAVSTWAPICGRSRFACPSADSLKNTA